MENRCRSSASRSGQSSLGFFQISQNSPLHAQFIQSLFSTPGHSSSIQNDVSHLFLPPGFLRHQSAVTISHEVLHQLVHRPHHDRPRPLSSPPLPPCIPPWGTPPPNVHRATPLGCPCNRDQGWRPPCPDNNRLGFLPGLRDTPRGRCERARLSRVLGESRGLHLPRVQYRRGHSWELVYRL